MPTSLPPLNALRAFEAAARRGGFASAASELHVTPAAVSHQVKALEAYLDVQLFHRRPRGLDLTDAGRQMLPQLTRGMTHLARAVGTVTVGSLSGSLTVSAAPSFATLWLVPRLESFLALYPEIELRILGAGPVPADLERGEADVRVPYGAGDYPGLVTRLLFRERIFPVCSPGLLNQSPLGRFADLRHQRLLHDINIGDDEPSMTWRRWLADAGVTGVDPERGVSFGDSVLMTEAAVRGQGVALGRDALVTDHLSSGRLVRPLKASRPADYAYWTVTTVRGAQQARVRAFIDWIEDRVANELPQPGG